MSQGRFRPIRSLGTAVVVLLAVNIALAVVMSLLRFLEMGMIRRAARGELVSIDEALASDRRVTAVAASTTIALLVTGVVWLVWQFRGHANLRAARLPELEYGPGWGVGWWFVPFANFVKPFGAVRELWKASEGRDDWWRVRTWPVVGWWWASWIVAGVFGTVGSITSDEETPTLDSLIATDEWIIATEVVVVIAAVLAILIVRSVGRRQDALVERVGVDGLLPPPPPRPDVPTSGLPPGP